MADNGRDDQAGTRGGDQEPDANLESIHRLFEHMFIEDRKAQGMGGDHLGKRRGQRTDDTARPGERQSE